MKRCTKEKRKGKIGGDDRIRFWDGLGGGGNRVCLLSRASQVGLFLKVSAQLAIYTPPHPAPEGKVYEATIRQDL